METLLNSANIHSNRFTEDSYRRSSRSSTPLSLDQLFYHSGSFLNYPFNIEKILKKVVSDFSYELDKKKWFIDVVSKENLIEKFIYSISKLIKLNPSFMGVELTSSDSLFIFSKIAGVNTHLEIFFDKDNKEDNSRGYDVVVNAYQDNEHILSQMGNIDESIRHLESILPRETTSLLKLIHQNDSSISRYSLTETTV
ncbi:hypothetical protein [Salegentibacter flavus]|uniref:Uncharacterized protein n=1 Tax=Salegentibacter flavus TaxID=287099 RepID=A0A1I4XH38_9FLAO|nr:hypothetical protein [Salegentibacter flavus]SFN24876.1 hypothetical protein SAMN05660413_00021 [Salegentibacter flavus]